MSAVVISLSCREHLRFWLRCSSIWVPLEVLEFQQGDMGMFSATLQAHIVLNTGAMTLQNVSRDEKAREQMPEDDVKVLLIWLGDLWMYVISSGSDLGSRRV